MKHLALFAALFTVPIALAQRASIGDPLCGASVAAGQQLLIRVDTQPSTSNVNPVGIALGIQSSTPSGFFPASQVLGTILFQGPYNPQYSVNASALPAHQNFTVEIPADFPKGEAHIGLAALTIVGASGSPLYGTDNVTVTVV